MEKLWATAEIINQSLAFLDRWKMLDLFAYMKQETEVFAYGAALFGSSFRRSVLADSLSIWQSRREFGRLKKRKNVLYSRNIRVFVTKKKVISPVFPDTNGVKLPRPNFLSKLFCPTIFCSSQTKDKMTEKGYGGTAVQTELQPVPRVHLTKPIIALFVVMKAQFSEVC